MVPSSLSVTVDNNEGLWANHGLGGVQQLCVRKGDPIPSTSSVTFRRFLQFGGDSSPTPSVFFLAQLAESGGTAANDLSLWYYHSGTMTLTQLLWEADFAPGTERGKIGVIQRVAFHPSLRGYTALCSLASASGGIDAGTNQVLLAGSLNTVGHEVSRRPYPILAKGMRFGRVGPDRIQSLTFLAPDEPTGALVSGLGSVIDTVRIACQVQFSNTDKELLHAYFNP